ncbi:MAG: Fe2+-dependent dioxygenase [Alphaproteobacteria bacterium]|nr:Fe2+-dependent dioxygenase [Alphaproteobacteria bacterium]
MILEIADVLTPDDLRQCRVALEAADWQDGRRTAGDVAASAKNNQQLADDDPLTARLGQLVLARLSGNDRFVAAALPLKVLPPRFNRYADSGHYADHVDGAVFSVPGTPHRVRSDLSATLFLSDPDEYDGGELVVASETGPYRVKLPAGHMVVYPGNTVHHVTAVTRGARIAAFFWIQSLVREGERRAMLLGLDESIRAVRTALPDDPSVTQLIGLYHNLLRHWSDT